MRHTLASRISICIIVATLLGTEGRSQPRVAPQYKAYTPSNFQGAVKLRIPSISYYPPLSMSMPMDVLFGYIYFDSLVGVLDHSGDLVTYRDNLHDSDTLRWALKYAYKLVDYDPVTFFQFVNMEPGHAYDGAGQIFSTILQRAADVIPDSGGVIASLVGVDGILDIQVYDTFCVVDTTKPTTANRCEGVHSLILDLIKGQSLSGLCDSSFTSTKRKAQRPLEAPLGCIAFQYWLYWQTHIQGYDTTFDLSKPLLTPGNEYIVCLKYVGLGGDSSGHYATLTLGLPNSTTMAVYPIRDGYVYDPNDDFRIGSGLTVSEFKSRLRTKIQSITSY